MQFCTTLLISRTFPLNPKPLNPKVPSDDLAEAAPEQAVRRAGEGSLAETGLGALGCFTTWVWSTILEYFWYLFLKGTMRT